MKRSKVSLEKAEIETQAELLETVSEVARLMLNERSEKNAMDEEIQAVRDKYQLSLAELATQIETATELVADYLTTHPDLLPKGSKSLDLAQAVIGFRTGTPKVKLLKRWTMATVLESITTRKWWDLIRKPEPELDKQSVIAGRDNAERLALVGLSVVQEETFFIEPKLEEQASGVKVGV